MANPKKEGPQNADPQEGVAELRPPKEADGNLFLRLCDGTEEDIRLTAQAQRAETREAAGVQVHLHNRPQKSIARPPPPL